ncbi:hypothetical protein ACOSQ2_031745 [Xanthoceras sorbifolium]
MIYIILILISQPTKFSNIRCDIPKLKSDNYKVWKERILFHLGWMDIDYTIRKDEPPAITDTSSAADIALYEKWERSNRLSVMFIKTKILLVFVVLWISITMFETC